MPRRSTERIQAARSVFTFFSREQFETLGVDSDQVFPSKSTWVHECVS